MPDHDRPRWYTPDGLASGSQSGGWLGMEKHAKHSTAGRRTSRLSVILFSGGRGSTVLSKELVNNPSIALTVAINGYDDGLSTGEVRRFLGDSLGPSDFRKNATRLARELHSCSPVLCELLEGRLPVGCTVEQWQHVLEVISGAGDVTVPPTDRTATLAAQLDGDVRSTVAGRLWRFEQERLATGRRFDFSDCSLGNLVFAGCFLAQGRRFNAGLDDFCAVMGLPVGLVDNVTDGTNAFLVALDQLGQLVSSEGEIVDATRARHIKDIFLIDRPLTSEEIARCRRLPADDLARFLSERSQIVGLNPRLRDRIASADLIIYSPGTQHSSLFPSYLTPGLSAAIAGNLRAVKLLITNIQADAEIPGSSAVDIIERAVYYLKEKGRLATPTPCLITHYLLNDPRRTEGEAPYIPLGRLDSLEDPRLVRIGNYEDGVSGRHDASKVLAPFIRSLVGCERLPRVAVWLHDCGSVNKVIQTLLEMVRAGVEQIPVTLTAFYACPDAIESTFARTLPFPVVQTAPSAGPSDALRTAGRSAPFDFVVLFESSGMYNGEDIAGLLSYLASGRLDAVWGSRRLSVRDITESLQLRYRHNVWLRMASALGSHLLSAAYLLLYGRYVSDTLSGVRAVRATYLEDAGIDLDDKLANQRLLSVLLQDKAEFLETPVQFLPLSPERVRRTSVLEGIQSLLMILWWRLRSPARRAAPRRPAEIRSSAS